MENEEKQRPQKIINNYFNAPIGQYIEHVEHNHYEGGVPQAEQQEVEAEFSTVEQMKRAVVATYRDGYWWSNRAWAVVYRVWQMKGYMRGYTQFVREVNEWELQIEFRCNYDAVQKPIAEGKLAGTPDKWVSQGAQGQAVRLAEALMKELEGM